MASKLSRDDPSSLDTLDSLEVFVLLDNVSDGMSTVPDEVTSEVPNLIKAGADTWTGDGLCCACWGWSLVLTGRVGGRSHTLLFDAGPAEYAIIHNDISNCV